jgi:hypothetical protein
MTTQYSVIKVLIDRDGMSRLEAEKTVRDIRERVLIHGEDPEEILYNDLGLEPDYIFDLIY